MDRLGLYRCTGGYMYLYDSALIDGITYYRGIVFLGNEETKMTDYLSQHRLDDAAEIGGPLVKVERKQDRDEFIAFLDAHYPLAAKVFDLARRWENGSTS